jgi:probable rRNA maturation factor
LRVSEIAIDICNDQQAFVVDEDRLRRSAAAILGDAGVSVGRLSIAIVDDPTIHELNRRYLAHDYATDVLSFVLERAEYQLEGEVVVSADTAARAAGQYGWSAGDELLLYVIHGALHLVGHDDATDEQRARMRQQERHYLALAGAQLPESSSDD